MENEFCAFQPLLDAFYFLDAEIPNKYSDPVAIGQYAAGLISIEDLLYCCAYNSLSVLIRYLNKSE